MIKNTPEIQDQGKNVPVLSSCYLYIYIYIYMFIKDIAS